MIKLYSALATATVIAAVNGLVQPAHAIEYPWCAQYGGHGDGGRNCGFASFEQCMATVSGIGGFCERNSFYQGSRQLKRPRRSNRYR